jgi:uncharacterized protein
MRSDASSLQSSPREEANMLRPGQDKGLATPIPLGLAALATTTFVMGIAVIFQEPAAWAPYLTQALMFGGLAELLAGMWAFGYGDALAATAFTFLGAFFGWWGLSHMTLLGVQAVSAVTVNSVATVFIVTGVVTLYLWIASFYESAAFNLALLFLWVSFGLMGIAGYSGVTVLALLGGISSLIAGVIAAYGSFAAIYNATSLQEVVPLGEPRGTRERAEQDEIERIRRIHPHGDHGEVHRELRGVS